MTPGPPGITGALPRSSKPSTALLHNAQNLARFAASAGPGGLQSRNGRNAIAALAGNPGAMAALPSGPLGIPGIVLQAYLRAQQIMASQQPGCRLPWWLLAGIGQIESGQADGGLVDAQGNTLVAILGPVLDGSNGTAFLPGERAVGPMQFLPSTWAIWGGGGNMNNVYDAALAAGRYLCAGGRNLSDPAQQAAAVFSYNYSDSYVQQVLTWAYAFAGGVHPLPPRTSPGRPPTTAAHHSQPRSPVHVAAPRGSSPSPKPTTTSPSQLPSSTPVAPAPSPSTTPPVVPSPSPTSASPSPSPTPPSPSPTPSPTTPVTTPASTPSATVSASASG
jgi:hypothetical protein